MVRPKGQLRPARVSGWTMLELLACLALAALASVAVLGVLGSLAAERQLLVREVPIETWRRQLTAQLRQDLAQAETYHWQPRELTLVGPESRDFTSGRPLHRPAEVRYMITIAANRRWLVREERHLDERSKENARRELVVSGVEEIFLAPWLLDETHGISSGTGLRASRRAAAEQNPAGALPERLWISLWSERAEPLLDEVCFRR